MIRCKKCKTISPLSHGTPEGWRKEICLNCRLKRIEDALVATGEGVKK